MITKEQLKKEIDKLPENLLEEVYKFVHSIKTTQPGKKKLHTFKLKGQFDHIHIRESAYDK